MKKLFILLVNLTIFSTFAFAQNAEKFDIITFKTPKGWQKEVKQNAVQLGAEDTNGGVCLVTMFKALPGSSDSKANFGAAWESIVKEVVTVKGEPQMQPAADENGWIAENGLAEYESDGKKGIALLVTITGDSKMVNILILTNSESFQQSISVFLDSVSLPPIKASPDQTQPQTKTAVSVSNGITKSTTNFNDGWTGNVQEDLVFLSKENLNIYLFYPVQMNDEMRVNIKEYFWRNYVESIFDVNSKAEWREQFSRIEFIEGDATEKQSGKSVFAAMNVLIENGVAKVVVATAPDKQTYYAQFPHPDKLAEMANANRFAVTASDVTGNWSGGGSAFAGLYSVYTGDYVGIDASAVSDQFVFNANGAYQSQHKGATGRVGVQTFFSEKHAGRFSVSDWEMTLTNRTNGRTVVYSAYFEAVKGGAILHLTDKQYSGMQYHLVKEK